MASEETSKPKRRIIKKAETVREKAQKQAQAKPKKQGTLALTWRYITWPFRMFGRGVAKIGRFVVPRYFKDSWRELRQVSWPSGRDTWKLTVAVIIFSAVFGVFITVVDFALDKLFRKVILS